MTGNHYFRLLLLILFTSSFNYSQDNNYTVNGFVKDRVTGEPLFGTSILVYRDSSEIGKGSFSGAATNNFGYYVIPSLPAGDYYFVIRHIGYAPAIRQIAAYGTGRTIKLNVDLLSEDIKLEEVIVTGKKDESSNVSRIDVAPELLAKLPSLTGEVDLFRMLQTLPGVKASNELSNGLYIRGGSPDQTLTLVDGIVLYNPSHMGNIASTFNSNAIRDITLIKGGFPAQYGGRMSSVLDIKLRSGTKEKEKGTIGLGLINSFLTLEGPISPGATYMLSGRGMYYDFIQKKTDKNGTAPRYNFYDVTTKINYDVSDNNIISLNLLLNKDKLYNPPAASDIDYDVAWENKIFNFNWLHINSNNLFLNTSISYIDYESNSFINKNHPLSATHYNASSALRDINFKQDVEFIWHKDHTFKTGIDLSVHNYRLVYSNVYDSLLLTDEGTGNRFNTFESAVYFQNESQFSEAFKTNIGFRLYYLGDSKYFRIEPRISASYALNGNLILKAGFGIANQYLHLISRNDISLPADIWFPSTSYTKPGISMQVVAGVDSYFDDVNYLISVEGYYKKMDNLYEFREILNYNPGRNNIEEQFTRGQGDSYGAELFLNKRSGVFTGWAGYTISWTRRKFPELNSGYIFYPKYDRRHDFSLVLTYEISSEFSTGITWVYSTGTRYTLPPQQFSLVNIINGERAKGYTLDRINTSFMPDYHKLDLNFLYKTAIMNNAAEFYLNFYNVYNRNNPFAQYLSVDDKDRSKTKLKRISYFPFIPTFGFNYKF